MSGCSDRIGRSDWITWVHLFVVQLLNLSKDFFEKQFFFSCSEENLFPIFDYSLIQIKSNQSSYNRSLLKEYFSSSSLTLTKSNFNSPMRLRSSSVMENLPNSNVFIEKMANRKELCLS